MKTQITNLANNLLNQNYTYKGVQYNPYLMGYRFKFHQKKRALGTCNYRTKTIAISEWVVEHSNTTIEEWHNTLLHEIAHAINHHLGGRGHDMKWYNIFIAIGGNGETTSSINYKVTDLLKNPISKYTIVCKKCGHTIVSHKFNRTIADGRMSCGKCHPHKFNKEYLLEQIQNY